MDSDIEMGTEEDEREVDGRYAYTEIFLFLLGFIKSSMTFDPSPLWLISE